MSEQAEEPNEDPVLAQLADYILTAEITNEEAFHTARLCLADSLGCGVLALCFPECTRLLGPVVAGTIVPHGSRVPGTDYILDPIKAAFDISTMIRWLDYNDTWLAAEWAHPSDNIGAILAVGDYLSRRSLAEGRPSITMKDLLIAIIKAYEIQGSLAMHNSYNRIGFDHVILVKVATAGVVTEMLGGNRKQIINALSQAFIDNSPLRTYRHGKTTGPRKSWAAGDAASRSVKFAWMSVAGEPGYPNALTASKWGINDVLFKGNPIRLPEKMGSHVIENILFKVSFPAEFHAQTAIEGAIKLHPQVRHRINDIQSIKIETQESAIRIIDKKGELKNPADRDHCLQYMVAVALFHGELKPEHYQDAAASEQKLHWLREKMEVVEHPQFTTDYLDPELRSIANSISVKFQDGTETEKITVEFPIGHRRRREEAVPIILQKCDNNLKTCFNKEKAEAILHLLEDQNRLAHRPVALFSDLFHK